MEEIRTINYSAHDVFNEASAKSLKDTKPEDVLTVSGVHICERPDNDGVIRTQCFFKTDAGIFGTVSKSVLVSATALPDLLKEEDAVKIKVVRRKGNSGREYLMLELAE